MVNKSIKRKRKVAATSKPESRRASRLKPNILRKYEAQVSHETFMDEIDVSGLEEYPPEEPLNEETREIAEELIIYGYEELDMDKDEGLDPDEQINIFDFSEGNPLKKIKADIILEEVVTYGSSDIEVNVYIPSKARAIIRKNRGNRQKEYEIRTDALENIGKLLAGKDRQFLLSESFSPELITPKIQKEIARLIRKDETWITRLKQSCIVQTPRWGLQPLSLFFPEVIPSSVENVSKSVIMNINDEDPFNTLSIEELAGIISSTESDYKQLTANAGSKLRRILDKLSIPPPNSRLKLAKVFMDTINEHKDASGSDIIKIVKSSCNDNISQLIIKYNDYSNKLIQRLKAGKADT